MRMSMVHQHASRWSRPFASGLLCAASLAFVLALCLTPAGAAGQASRLPDPAVDAVAPKGRHLEKAVLAGGCFWGVQAVFQHVDGVANALSGYSGGARENAEYEAVSTGRTGHAEAVEVTFDPEKISYGRILQIFFSAAHDPTELNRQGPDHGPQYRSAIFVNGDEQRRIAESYIGQLTETGAFGRPIVTKVDALKEFYPAEAYHQNYATLHPDSPYIAINDRPKVVSLKRLFPDLYRAEPVLAPRPTAVN